jgi:hypothetical protein
VLPQDCRALLGRRPVLAHPNTGAVLAFALGTAYVLLVPPDRLAAADALGVRAIHRWGGGKVTDLAAEVGTGWRFGAWQNEEYDWCCQSYSDAEAGAERRAP